MVFDSQTAASAFAAEVEPLLADSASSGYCVSEEGGSYDIEYRTQDTEQRSGDLLDGPRAGRGDAAAPDAGRGAARVQDGQVAVHSPGGEKEAIQLQLFAARGQKSASRSEKLGAYAHRIVTFDLERVTGPEDAAHILATLGERAQEVFFGLVLNADGRPLGSAATQCGRAGASPCAVRHLYSVGRGTTDRKGEIWTRTTD
ncbi:MAG: hypothetical protein ACOY4W_00815 [Thermodesulfobacteriota bacterium]